jgi:TPR repeat protein
MPVKLISCISLPPATISSVPIRDYVKANKEFADKATEVYYSCCGKSICRGCAHSFMQSGNIGKCPYCNAETMRKTNEERVEEMMKRVEVNDAGAIYALGTYHYHGHLSLLQDRNKAIELWKQAAKLGSSQANYQLGSIYREGGDLKREKFHFEAAAMAGHEVARNMLGNMEFESGNKERAVKHWIIAASAGNYLAMYNLLVVLGQGVPSRESIDSTLTAYNNSCAEMRSEARDAHIHIHVDNIGER